MAIYSLYQDAEDLHTIVRGSRGWPGAFWSSSLFAADCWRLVNGDKTELDRPTRAWMGRLLWPESIATWCSASGRLTIADTSPGSFAERYLALVYDEWRWVSLEPGEFRVAVLAAASHELTASTAVSALLEATPAQLASLSHDEARQLLCHPRLDLRLAATRLCPDPQPVQAGDAPPRPRLRHGAAPR
jgi:hypothetical protein